eukprot:gb/GEZN01009327.1/.p1 GENE.gb/GEZN01009327.1/~~gb/GEZN01009327.1/.p1  ORF type:complete len:205 (+),score=20.78 gb/GEZN01009327.1/:684-1298(+)
MPSLVEEALAYARTHLVAYPNRIAETQKLMLCLVFCTGSDDIKRQLQLTEFYDPAPWTQVTGDLIGCHARSLGLLTVSPLFTTLLASDLVLPTRLQVASLIQEKKLLAAESSSSSSKMTDIEAEGDESVFGIDLGPAFQFHSCIVCPIRKDQTTSDNPPILLKCGHVISQDAMLHILTQVRSERFKCPTCPTMQGSEDTLILRL